MKAKRRQSSKQRFDTATTETLTLVKEAVQNCPTKELILFMKEEMEKSRQRELKFFQLFLTQRSEANFHSIPYSSNEHRYNANLSPYPRWHSGAQAMPSHSESSIPEWSLGPLPGCNGIRPQFCCYTQIHSIVMIRHNPYLCLMILLLCSC